MYYTRTKLGKIQTPKTFCGTQSKNFHVKVWKVSVENTRTWKLKTLASSLDVCAATKLAQITMLEESKMKQKSSMTDGVYQNGATEKCKNISTSYECLCWHEIQGLQAFHLKFKAKLSRITAVLKIFAVEFNCRKQFLRRVFLRNFLDIISQFRLLFGISQLFCPYCNKIFLIFI